MKNLKKIFLLVLFISAFANVVSAQTSKDPGTHWTFDVHTMYDATLTGELFLDGESMRESPDAEYLEIGAFCGDVCCGSYIPDYVPLPFYTGYAYQMQIYSNESSCDITFRIYDHQTETELDVICNSPIIFSPNTVYGDLMNPFQLDFTSQFNITAIADPAEGGTITGDGTFIYGETCSLTAVANSGYSFVNWTSNGAVLSTEAVYSFEVHESAQIEGNFAVDIYEYEIVAVAKPEGYGTVTGGGTYVEGETCKVTATPTSGHMFVNWTENGEIVSNDAEYTFVVTGDRELVANFDYDGVGESEGVTFVLYPNSATDKIMIESTEFVNRCEIYSVNGSLVLTMYECTEHFEVNVNDYAAGSYIIRLFTDKGVQMRRFIKN